MEGVPVFTLDTSCVIHAVRVQQHAADIVRLTDAARADRLGRRLTAAFDADLTSASNENLEANLRWLAGQPILQAAPGPFRPDYSHLDGTDVLISDEQAAVIEVIEAIVLPSR